ncbi:WhiB family transcriptional regulator [Actinomadura sp. WMMA1423]|uniref:WhiB family transcriptional regulator n=1 Tax=Actinomadura sp. WMMA1423 TaxID=2591108 RepID=UPI0011471192|nr:WhiB family transcriptional regulator [Actinomadura sp. WMMA1423]
MTRTTLHWEEEAACRSLDPDLFFPVADETVYAAQIAVVRRVCAACPAASLCLEWALTTGEPDGIWAGTTPGERRRLRAARRRARPAAEPARPGTRADAA